MRLGAIDGILEEPVGGAHRNHDEAADRIQQALKENLSELERLAPRDLLSARLEKFLAMGIYDEA